MTRFYAGVDVGQAYDYTALAILEAMPEVTPDPLRPGLIKRRRRLYHCRHLERLPLGTPYPAQVVHIHQLVHAPPLEKQTHVALDSTGVGRPVFDLFHEGGVRCTGVLIHGGDHTSREGHVYRVPKRDLIAGCQIALQNGSLKIANRLPHAETLMQELLNYRVKIDPLTAHDSYNAREGQHDDLVLALCLAVWLVEHGPQPIQVMKLSGL